MTCAWLDCLLRTDHARHDIYKYEQAPTPSGPKKKAPQGSPRGLRSGSRVTGEGDPTCSLFRLEVLADRYAPRPWCGDIRLVATDLRNAREGRDQRIVIVEVTGPEIDAEAVFHTERHVCVDLADLALRHIWTTKVKEVRSRFIHIFNPWRQRVAIAEIEHIACRCCDAHWVDARWILARGVYGA